MNRSSIGNLINTDCNEITQEITNDENKANAFINFFIDEPNINIALPRDIAFQGTVRKFEFTDTAILKKLKGTKTNKSAGPDNIQPRVLNELQNIIPGQLSKLFKFSFDQGKLPDEWKVSTGTVIHKKGKKMMLGIMSNLNNLHHVQNYGVHPS